MATTYLNYICQHHNWKKIVEFKTWTSANSDGMEPPDAPTTIIEQCLNCYERRERIEYPKYIIA